MEMAAARRARRQHRALQAGGLCACLAGILWLSLATLAAATTCAPYAVSDAYRAASADGGPHVIVRGTLRFDPDRWPRVDPQSGRVRKRTRVPARIEGVSIGPFGQRARFSEDIGIIVQCDERGCPPARQGDALALLKQDGRRYSVETAVCGGLLFYRLLPQAMRLLQSCLDGRYCPTGPEIFQRLFEDGDVLPIVARE